MLGPDDPAEGAKPDRSMVPRQSAVRQAVRELSHTVGLGVGEIAVWTDLDRAAFTKGQPLHSGGS